MQADELKAIRTGLGMSQQAFADALGMSRKAVNEMEKGHAVIERRTELAAREVGGSHGVHPFAIEQVNGEFFLHTRRRRFLGEAGQLLGYTSSRHPTGFATESDAREYAHTFEKAAPEQFASSVDRA